MKAVIDSTRPNSDRQLLAYLEIELVSEMASSSTGI